MRLRNKIPLIGALMLFSLVIPGCTTAEKPPVSCPPDACRVVIPPCQPPAHIGMSHDAISQVGFVPYVATWLPDTVFWYTAQPYPVVPSSAHVLSGQPRPLMRIGYGYNFPRPYNAYALHGVIAFDETTQALGLTTNIYVPGQTLAVVSKASVDINGHAATLFELRGSASMDTASATHIIGVEWQTGTLWVRVTAVTTGRYALLSNGEGDDVVAWDGTSTDFLLRVARSARPYTGCGRNVSGAG